MLSENLIVTEPTMTFSDRLTLDLGDLTLSLVYFGSAHSESDIIVHLPEEGLLITGDIFRRSRPINLSYTVERVDVSRWITALNFVLDDENSVRQVLLNWEVMMTRAELVLLRDYLSELWEGVVAAKEEGLELDAALESLSLADRFSCFRWFDLSIDGLRSFHTGLIQLLWRQE